MAEKVYVSGKGSSFTLIDDTTSPVTISIPLLPGSYRNVTRNVAVDTYAQGNPSSVWPETYALGPSTTGYTVTTRAIPSGWFTAANLNKMFVTRDSNGDSQLMGGRWNDGLVAHLDTVKPTGLQIVGNASSPNPVAVQMGFIGTNAAGTTPGAHVSVVGAAEVTFNTITFKQGSTTPTQVSAFDLTIGISAEFRKWFNGNPTSVDAIDPGSCSGRLRIVQGLGAAIRVDDMDICTFEIGFGPSAPVIAVSCIQAEGSTPVNIGGNASMASTWAVVAVGANPAIAITQAT
ncbi:MAG TPA: hypothetical protein VGM51_09565 [Armatimonadota bacterium]|jgi:hypothetical protein